MIIPDMTYLFVAVINNKDDEHLELTCMIFYAVSNLLDAAIYIYFLKDVRKFLLAKIKMLSGDREQKQSMISMNAIPKSHDEKNLLNH